MKTMDHVLRTYLAWLPVAGLWAIGGGCREAPDEVRFQDLEPIRIETPNIAKNYFKVGNVRLAGQPNDEGFDELKEEGIRTVINLRPDAELGDLDEKAEVERRGMVYVSIPVSEQEEHLRDATIETFLATLRSSEKPVVIHCGSANRVSALWAVYLAVEKGVPPRQALALAEKSGMREGYACDFVKDYMARKIEAPTASEPKGSAEKAGDPGPESATEAETGEEGPDRD